MPTSASAVPVVGLGGSVGATVRPSANEDAPWAAGRDLGEPGHRVGRLGERDDEGVEVGRGDGRRLEAGDVDPRVGLHRDGRLDSGIDVQRTAPDSAVLNGAAFISQRQGGFRPASRLRPSRR